MGAVWAPGEAIDHAAVVVAPRAATSGPRPAKRVEGGARGGICDVGRVAVRAIPVHASGDLAPIWTEFNGSA